MFNKGIFYNEKEENDKNKELTEEDYEQINKEISKALSEMKKEKQEDDSDENSNKSEKELNNFDYDFFSDNSNSISNDNFSDISENSFKSANVEMNKNNSLKINMLKNNFKSNNNNNMPQLPNGRSNSIEDILFNESPLIKDSNSFKHMNNQRNNNIQNNLNRSFNSSPYLPNININSLFKKNYLNDSGFNNINNNNNNHCIQINNQNMTNNLNNFNNLNKLNNNNIQNLPLNNQQIINNNNYNFINVNNNNFNNNNPLNNINIVNYSNSNKFPLNNMNIVNFSNNNNNNANNFLSFQSISDRGVPGLYNLDSPKNIINLDNILKSRDKRTTLIIRNIPNKYTISLLLDELNKNFEYKFDIVYLPQDYINNSNLGFGFINFVNHMHLILFYDEFVGKKWNCFNSKKRCQLAYSKYQGKTELMKYIHTKLGISNLDNNNENIKKSFFINNNKSIRAPIEIPIKYYSNFISFYPFSLCQNKDDKVFIIEKYYNI